MSPCGDDERGRTLQALYEALWGDVVRLGTLIETDAGVKANPSVALLIRVVVELDRRQASRARSAGLAEAGDDLAVVLRMVD